MPSKEEKDRRKKIQKELVSKDYEIFIKSLPIDKSLVLEMFKYLDAELSVRECKQNFQITLEFLESKNIRNEKIIDWFQEQGGYCDCEILYNLEEKFNK